MPSQALRTVEQTLAVLLELPARVLAEARCHPFRPERQKNRRPRRSAAIWPGTAKPRRHGNGAPPPDHRAAAARQAASRAIKSLDANLTGEGLAVVAIGLRRSLRSRLRDALLFEARTRFSWFASIAARVRLGKCNFCSTAVTCLFTVFKEQERSSAISRLLLPAATSSRTSRCRGLRLSTSACAFDVLGVSLGAGLNCLANAFAIVS